VTADAQIDVGDEAAVAAGAGVGDLLRRIARRRAADIGLVGVAADDEADRRVEPREIGSSAPSAPGQL